METGQPSLNIHWAFGFSKDMIGSVQSLCSKDRNALFFLSGHSGVVYDFEHRKQTILQGHCNIITCCAVDKTKRWIVTADSGFESIMVVWDAMTFLPVKTFMLPHQYGVKALDFSDDGMYIATLSTVPQGSLIDQELAIWAWTTQDETPIQQSVVQTSGVTFHSVRFDPCNPHQLVTTSDAAVHYWDWKNFVLESYNGKVSKTDIGHFSGEFTTTIFLPEADTALTATNQGFIIVWENRNETRKDKHNQPITVSVKVAVKVVKLLECGVNILDVTPNKYLVLGCADGAVRFYDYFLRLEAWFEDLNSGPVTSITFSMQSCPYSPLEAGQPGLKFWVPDFLVGTKKSFIVGVESSIFDEIKKEDRRGTLLMQGLNDQVIAVACHPVVPLVAFLCKSGILQLWNYEMKLLMNVREFSAASASHTSQFGEKTINSGKHVYARDIAFHPSGLMLMVGFSSGIIKALSVETLQDIQNYSPSTDSVEKLKFSSSGNYLAATDEQFHVLLFKRESNDDVTAKGAFTYIGRVKSHTAKITGLEFGMKDTVETLVSVSEDRYALEYDLVNSTVSSGLLPVKSLTTEGATYCQSRIEMLAKPSCMFWHPKRKDDVEDRFITVNSEFKMKEYNVESKQCRKTVLAPRFGYPPNSLLLVPHSERTMQYRAGDPPIQYTYWQAAYVFSTPNRVIGIGQFPLDGNPTRSVGIVAHAGEITGFAVSFDGRFAFSAGGHDLTVNMWSIGVTNPTVADVKNDLAPYLALLEGGGQYGELHQSLVDYFYYCQLRHGGEDTMDTRQLNGLIPLEELPALMRAVGFYPSEDEVRNMINEVSVPLGSRFLLHSLTYLRNRFVISSS
jgi:WD40 repeat protein